MNFMHIFTVINLSHLSLLVFFLNYSYTTVPLVLDQERVQRNKKPRKILVGICKK